MNEICRLCCTTKFVSNDIFDEENALYLKMSLYLPIKVFKNDRLPQKICDKCSCKVNDFYQFCNETIEVQNRLRAMFLTCDFSIKETIDLTCIKKDIHSPSPAISPPPNDTNILSHCEQGTQTDYLVSFDIPPNKFSNKIPVKEEPQPQVALKNIKVEQDFEDDDQFTSDLPSDNSHNSDDLSLSDLKRMKTKPDNEISNGYSEKKNRKKERKLKNIEFLIDSLPEGMAVTVVNDEFSNVQLQSVNQEAVEVYPEELGVNIDNIKPEKIKSEPNSSDAFNCCICFKRFHSRNAILQHYKQHREELNEMETPSPPPYPDKGNARCLRCRKTLDAKTWSSHWLRHWELDRQPYRCALCEKSFRDHQQIFKHGLVHTYDDSSDSKSVGKRFMCDLCPEGFVYLRYLLVHRTRAHPEAAGRAYSLRCVHCSRSFAHQNSLLRHMRGHTGEKNHLCNVCGKRLSSNEHLKFHIRIHTGDKPNICKTCGKGFVKKCNLTLHERVHSGEKPHVCSHCGKAFSQRSTLVIHERYHSGARPYKCALCGRGFVAKGLLSMHLKTTCI